MKGRSLLFGALYVAIFAGFFMGTLAALDYFDAGATRNRARAEHARLLAGALQKFKDARGTFPAGGPGPITDFKKDLVDGGFLAAIPSDPKGQPYTYIGAVDRYGLLFVLEQEPFLLWAHPTLICLTGVKIKGQGAWGEPPECQF